MSGESVLRPRVVLAVTSPQSLQLMRGYPEYLVSCGWRVEVVVGAAPGVHDSLGPDQEHMALHVVPMARDPQPRRDLAALVQWVRVLRRLRPDLVVSGTPKAGLLGMLSAVVARVPARVYLLRGLRLETEVGVRLALLWALEWITARCARSIVAVSPSLREEYVRRRLAPPSRVTVLGSGSSNGVDTSRSVTPEDLGRVRAETGIELGDMVVGFVGRIAPDKGLGTLLQAIGSLRREGNNVSLLIVGGEESGGYLRAELDRNAADASGVVWVGHVGDSTPYYSLMSVLCLPTRREGFPNVVLEAAAQGVPAVVTTATGARDSVVDGLTGLQFPPGDAAALAKRLSEVLADEAYRASLGAEARARVETEFDQELVWRTNETYLRSVIEHAIKDR